MRFLSVNQLRLIPQLFILMCCIACTPSNESSDRQNSLEESGSQDKGDGTDSDLSDDGVPPINPPEDEAPPPTVPDESPFEFSNRSNVLPTISFENAYFTNHKADENLLALPTINNDDVLDGYLHWIKIYGPDGVNVHPETGVVQWDIPNNLPNESFHVGIKASAVNGSVSTSFIVHAGVTDVITVGPSGDHPTIKDGLNALTSGGTMVVQDGIYTGYDNYIGLTGPGAVQHPPSGSAFAYTNVIAEHPGQVILKDDAYIRLHGQWPVSYITFKGFYVVEGQIASFGYGANKEDSRRNHHLKFIRNGVEGGERLSPFNAFRSDDILFENNYALGGGRYKFTSYEAENIVWRRNVARYDRGTFNNEPKGTYSVYTTMNAFLGNNLAIDGDNPHFVNSGELAGEFTTPTTSGHTRARFQRNIQLNSAFLFGNMDEQKSNGSGGDSDVEHKDIISWDVRPDHRYVMTWGSAWFDHMTMGEIHPRSFASTMFNGYHDNSRGVTNSILHNFTNGDLFYSLNKEAEHLAIDRTVERYGVDTINVSNFTGNLESYDSDIVNVTTLNPIRNSENSTGALKYLTRLEPQSNLSDKALDGLDIGATVMTFVGQSGTLVGEEGFDVETNIPMWPFPMEDIIKEKFSSYAYTGDMYEGSAHDRSVTGTGTLSGARGFAVEGESLTHYVWGYLGNPVPPFNVTLSRREGYNLLQWQPNPALSQDAVTGYRVYSYDASTHDQTLITELLGQQFTFGFAHEDDSQRFVVTAVTSSGESGFSYPISYLNP